MGAAAIDPRAVVHPDATLGDDVVVGPYCVIGPEVAIGDRCRLDSHVVVDGATTLGPDNAVSPFASLGGPPRDLKYRGEPTRLTIGARNTIASTSRSTAAPPGAAASRRSATTTSSWRSRTSPTTATWARTASSPTPRPSPGTSASRLGEPFESGISKYGIPNTSYPHCTRELKLAPIESYARSLGWGNSYTTAIGIRLDETRRVRKDAASCSIVYPLVDWFPSDKSDVNDFWERQKFSLMLEEHEGNCKWCWKKSFSKHARLLKEKEEIYDFPSRMEIEYGHIQSNQEKERGQDNRVFFRGNRSTSDLKRYCSALEHQKRITDPDENAGCGESCELYSTIQLDF